MATETTETGPIKLPVKAKYLQRGGKSIKNTNAGNGKMDRDRNKVSWKAGTGMGRK